VTTLQLREWVTTPAVPLSPAERDALRNDLRATVQPSAGSEGHYDVTPGNTVGTVLVGDTQLLVEPKMPITHLLFLLGYCADPVAWREEPVRFADVLDVVSGVASLYATLCERATSRGLLRGYHEVEAELATVRGRIDIAEQLRRRPGLDLPLAVRYVEHDDDVTENRLLLAAAQLFRRTPLRGPSVRRSLHRLADTLQNVSPVAYRSSAIPEVGWTRLNQHYRPAVELARLLLRQRSVDLAAGSVGSAALTLDMAVLFEEFVRTALREALSASADTFPSGARAPRLALDARGRVRLEPDLSYWRHGRCTFVGDVKYKRDTGAGRSPDLYQLLAYATATRLPEATLIYAQGPEEPRVHEIPHAAVRLRIEHLDLSRSPTLLLEDLADIARHIAEPATSAPGERGDGHGVVVLRGVPSVSGVRRPDPLQHEDQPEERPLRGPAQGV